MTDDDRGQFAQSLAGLCVAMGEEFTEQRAGVYFAALRDLEIAEVTHAIATAIQTCKFFPRPAELRELAGSGAPDVGLVEGLIVKHLSSRGGERRSPDDPFLKLVFQRLGGVRAAIEMPAGVRLSALKSILPGCVQAARVRGLDMPNEATAALPAIARRIPDAIADESHRGNVIEMPTRRIGGANLGDVLAHVMPKKSEGGES